MVNLMDEGDVKIEATGLLFICRVLIVAEMSMLGSGTKLRVG